MTLCSVLPRAHSQGRGSLTRVPSLGMRLESTTLPRPGFRDPRRAKDEGGVRPRRGERVPRGGWMGASWQPGGWRSTGKSLAGQHRYAAHTPDPGAGQELPCANRGCWTNPARRPHTQQAPAHRAGEQTGFDLVTRFAFQMPI